MTNELHAHHRTRMRDRFCETTGIGFGNHELLEMLLYYSIPRKNTNDIAHRLLKRFGGFEGVFSAEIDELMQVDNIGEKSAVQLKLIFEIYKRMLEADNKNEYRTYEEIGELFVKKLRFAKEENVILLLFNKRGGICREVIVAAGDNDSAVVDIRKIMAASACKEAHFAAVAHNHPSGLLRHSFDDEQVTMVIKELLIPLKITLVDHYVIAEGKYMGILHDNYRDLSI